MPIEMTEASVDSPFPGSTARARAWRVLVLLGGAAVAAYVVVPAAEARAVVIVALPLVAAVAVVLGVRAYRPVSAWAWYALAASQVLWVVGWILWQTTLLRTGAPPAPTAAPNFWFLAGYPLVGVALAFLVRRREADFVSFIDTALVVVGTATVAWAVLLASYVDDGSFSPEARGVQIAYGLADVLLFGAALRAILAPGRKSPAFVALVAGALGTVGSDFVWNWATRLGQYTPGSWADAGWLVFSLLIGVAGLHPSMRGLFAQDRAPERVLRWDRLALLGLVTLLGPTVIVRQTTLDDPNPKVELIGAAAATACIALLVLARLALILREGDRLSGMLAVQNERLRTLDRLKDDFVSAVSHELRTPLTSIRGYLELVLDPEEDKLSEQQRRFLGVVDRNSERLLRLVGDLLFVAQVEAGQLGIDLEAVDLNAIIDDATQSAQPLAREKKIALVLEAQPLPTISGDRSRLAQLLDNLVSNALKFTPAGGTVIVRARVEDGTVVLEVEDTGIGIAADDQARLFDRFFRTSEASAQAIQGTGLGLAIAKAIVEGHGGSISVASVVQEGTTFRVVLPAPNENEHHRT